MKKNKLTLKDMSSASGQLVELNPEEFMKLPYPYDTQESQPALKPLTDEVREKYECGLDGHLALKLPQPKSKEEEEQRKAEKGRKKGQERGRRQGETAPSATKSAGASGSAAVKCRRKRPVGGDGRECAS